MSLFGKKVYNFHQIHNGEDMKSVILSFFVIILIVGCSYKHDNLYVGKKKTTEQSVANTKKSQIMQNGKVKIFVTVTYLDSLSNQAILDKNKEQFIVGIHFVNFGTKETKRDLETKDIRFYVGNETHLVDVKKLKPNSPILKIIPASNPWSQYFLVETPRIEKNSINFSMKILNYKEISLLFEKDY